MERPEELNQEKQMKFAFMDEGGILADDGVDRDPVSGNEVPAGSMAEEVRDDVPAMLSEGEYVVPADVVRYHGIDKFEDLRDEAKMGLARMEADGRIGGQPVEEQEDFPFPVEELEGFQEGGAVGDTYSDVTGSDFKANQPYGAGGGRFPGLGFELRNFTDSNTGKTVVIPFFNGRPMQYIPPNFLEGGATTTQGGTVDPVADEKSRQEDEAEAARIVEDKGMSPLALDAATKALSGQETQAQPKSFDEYTSEDWNNYIKNSDSFTADITAKIPVVGLLQRMNEKAARSFAEKALRSGVNPATEKSLSSQEILTLQKVLMVAPNTSMTEAVINAVTGKGETIQGVPLFEQKGFEADLLPDVSKFKEAEPTGPFYKAGETDAPVTEEDLPFFPKLDAPDFVTQEGGTVAPTQQVDTQRDDFPTSKSRRESRGTKASNIFDMSASAQIASANAKEGLFYNPGNIEIGQNYAGEIGTYADGRFAQFSTPQFGVRALAVDMKTKADRYDNNVESMLLEYLGGGRTGSRTSKYKKAEIENPNARTYINNAIKAVGSKKIDTSNVKQMKGLIEQIIKNENTKDIADFYLDKPNVIEEGIVLSQKSFPKETQLADARKALSNELFSAGLVATPPTSPFETGQAVAQPTEVVQPQDVSQFYGQRFDPTQIDTDDMLKQAAQNIPAGSDIGGATPSGFQNIIAPQVTRQSDLPFVQGPSVAPTVGSPAVSPATAQDMQMQKAFSIPRRDVAGTTTAPTIGGTGVSGTLPQVDTTTPTSKTIPTTIQDVAPIGDRKVRDAKEFLAKRKAAQQAVEDAISFAPKTKEKPKAKTKKEEQISQQEYEQRVADATRRENEKARDRADSARDSVLRQGGSVQEAFDAAQTAFTGFTPSGEMVDPFSNPVNVNGRLEYRNRGGLASKSKKTKPKKRNTKKGLGGKMAT